MFQRESMGFPTRVFFPVLLLLCSIFSIQSTAQNLGFRCTNTTSTATCNSLIDYKLPNTTTLAFILNLFEIKNLRSLLAANNLPIPAPAVTAPESPTAVPDDGLYHIAAEVFSNLVTYQQIQSVNNIPDANNISIGQKLWIPLPCSCDEVNEDTVVHYGHLVAAGDSVSGYAEQYNTMESALLSLNGLNNSADLKADAIFDVPLKEVHGSEEINSFSVYTCTDLSGPNYSGHQS